MERGHDRKAGGAGQASLEPSAVPGKGSASEQLAGTSQRKGSRIDWNRLPFGGAPASGGLPDDIRPGLESAYGMDLSGVRVHGNSAEASGLGAEAFARGGDIHFASGRDASDRHLLAHEVAHVVQQAEGRVSPTLEANGTALNDSEGLEAEADRMAVEALAGRVARTGPQLAPATGQVAQGYFKHGREIVDAKSKEVRAVRHALEESDAGDRVIAAFDASVASSTPAGTLAEFARTHRLGSISKIVEDYEGSEESDSSSDSGSEEDPPNLKKPRSQSTERRAETVASPTKRARVEPKAGPPATSSKAPAPASPKPPPPASPKPRPAAATPATRSAGPRLLLQQFGGSTGSQAGDTLGISPQHSRRYHAVDLGKGGQEAAQSAFRTEQAKQDPDEDASEWESFSDDESGHLKTATLTHGHADHIGTPAERNAFEAINVGTSRPKDLPAAKAQSVTKSGDRLFGFRERARGLSVTGSAIVPDPPKAVKKKVDDNALSLGALIKVDHKQGTNTRRAFTFLTLGDMTPNEARDPVKAAVTEDKNPVDLLKLSHHGSENNIGAVPAEAIGRTTRILISGYTMTDTKKLAEFLEGHKHGEVFILFHSQDLAARLTSTAVWKRLEAQGVKVARDYLVSIDATGTVTQQAYSF